jgi:Protein of unknown function (DUF2800)
MNAPLEPAHSRFGGSVATRILRCPRSVPLVEKVPAHLRRSSAYAERGSALHVAVPRLIERECSLDDLVGAKIGDYVVTRDDVENSLRPVLAFVDGLLDQGAEYFLEKRVAFPAIAGAFGTADLLARIGRTVHVTDYKFGSGVLVRALSPADDDPAVDVVNSQLLFYGAAARHSLPALFAGGVDTIVLTILQPQSIEIDTAMESSVAVTHAELDEFIALFRAACAEALTPSPRLEKGVHCRFCPARPICPLHTAPLLDLAQFEAPAPLPSGGAFAKPPAKEDYLRVLAAGLNLVDAAREIGKALHDQAKQALHAGDDVPEYALTAGRAVRDWRDENAAQAALIELGLVRDDIISETMRSPKQIELRAKARNLKIPQSLIVSRPSGVSLVRAENARDPVPGRDEIVRSFSEALKAFQEGNPT